MAKEYAKEFYLSKAWRHTRAAFISYCGGMCERCMKEYKAGRRSLTDVNPITIVHHRTYITPDNINDPKITLSFSNLEGICDEHHNREHKEKEKRYSFAPDGTIIPQGRTEDKARKDTVKSKNK